MLELRIRPEQVAALRAPAIGRFVARAVQHLRAHYRTPFGTDDEGELEACIRAEVDRGQQYGLKTSRGLLRFLHLGAIYGPGFEHAQEHRWMRAFLVDERVSEVRQRVALLLDECIRRARLRQANVVTKDAYEAARGSSVLPEPFALWSGPSPSADPSGADRSEGR